MYGLYDDVGWGGKYDGLFGRWHYDGCFWVLLIVFIVWVVREVSGKNLHSQSGSNALEILKEIC